MTAQQKALLTRYLSATYAVRDTALLLREACRTFQELSQAEAAWVELYRDCSAYRFCPLPDGTYRLRMGEAPLDGGGRRLALCSRTDRQPYGAVVLEGVPDRVEPLTDPALEKLSRVFGEQLYAALSGSELALLLDGEKTLTPRDGSLPAGTLAVLAHEMRAPLAAALAGIETIQKRLLTAGVEDPIVERLCVSLRENMRRSIRSSTNLLMAAKGRELSPQLEWIDVVKVLEEVIEGIEPYAHRRDVKMELACVVQSEAREMFSDRQYLESIALNLASNAVRHASPGNGRIWVEIRREETMLEFSVRDNGPGIPAGEEEHIFEKYWRADRPGAASHAGAGLGLYLVRMFSRALGGDVRVENHAGAKFTVTLPARTEMPVETLQMRSQADRDEYRWISPENEFAAQEELSRGSRTPDSGCPRE